MIQQTSLVSWVQLQPTIGRRQLQVMHALSILGQATNQELADYLHWGVNKVTPRVLELRQKGIVELSCMVNQANGRPAMKWRLI